MIYLFVFFCEWEYFVASCRRVSFVRTPVSVEWGALKSLWRAVEGGCHGEVLA